MSDTSIPCAESLENEIAEFVTLVEAQPIVDFHGREFNSQVRHPPMLPEVILERLLQAA